MSKQKPHAADDKTVDPTAGVDSRLDEALMENFPASDPIAVDPVDHPAPHQSKSTQKPATDAPAANKKRH
ncbi:hypothetical protein PQQ51_25050 [Paraburkholderia xenovorans]|uniref:hypothetical protein n=1 Tax=Paraburkholderia xenovorans TaxID=36873 RepID=UPI0038BC46AF